MSLSILEVLQNAKYNIVENAGVPVAYSIGKVQLVNAVTMLEKGYSPDEDFDTVMGDNESVEDVPESSRSIRIQANNLFDEQPKEGMEWKSVLSIILQVHEHYLPKEPIDHEQSELYMYMAKRIASQQSTPPIEGEKIDAISDKFDSVLISKGVVARFLERYRDKGKEIDKQRIKLENRDAQIKILCDADDVWRLENLWLEKEIARLKEENERLKGLIESNYVGWFRAFYRATSTMTARQISAYEAEQWEQFKAETNLNP